eukprot:jgi/Orpsp1_1/1175221/evm.model.c7180000053075.1
MNKSISIFFLIILLFINNIKAVWLPSQGMTWNYVLGDTIDPKKETAKVVDIDIRKDISIINALHKKGIKVICYFSAGTLEFFRDDYPQFLAIKGLVQNTYEAWPEERWLDFRIEDIKPLLKNRMKNAVKKSCDGIEVDNLDGYQMKEVKSWKKPLTKSDTIKFAKWLANTAHSLGLSIGLKNVPGLIDELTTYYDFAINEECVKYNECKLYKNFLKTGKAVFGVTYNGLSENRSALCKNLNGLGISMIVKTKKKLVQDGVIFDGKKQCGGSFNSAVNSCFAIPLGYPCCTTTRSVSQKDSYGTWGIENGSWCGITPASKTGSSNGGSSSSSCFSKSLGFPCCSSKNTKAVYTDSRGTWGVENDNWCGISKTTKTCFATSLGYSCCSSDAVVYAKDSYGSWSIEYGEWCGIPKSTATTKKKTTKKVVTKIVTTRRKN